MTIFFMTVAISMLFGIANQNGTTAALSQNIVALARGNTKLIPILFFLLSAIISGIGVGAPLTPIIMPIALLVALQNEIPVLLMCVTTVSGIMIGGLSPYSLSGIVASTLAAEQGLTNYWPIYRSYAVVQLIFAIYGRPKTQT